MLFLFSLLLLAVFFFTDTPTTEIYTLSLHDALPICDRPPPRGSSRASLPPRVCPCWRPPHRAHERRLPGPPRWPPVVDRKSTRLNSSHVEISYAVFCLKKKKS